MTPPFSNYSQIKQQEHIYIKCYLVQSILGHTVYFINLFTEYHTSFVKKTPS